MTFFVDCLSSERKCRNLKTSDSIGVDIELDVENFLSHFLYSYICAHLPSSTDVTSSSQLLNSISKSLPFFGPFLKHRRKVRDVLIVCMPCSILILCSPCFFPPKICVVSECVLCSPDLHPVSLFSALSGSIRVARTHLKTQIAATGSLLNSTSSLRPRKRRKKSTELP